MQLLIIVLCITVFYLWMRGDTQEPRRRSTAQTSRRDQEQIERLKARVATLESILLDRDRKFRDGI